MNRLATGSFVSLSLLVTISTSSPAQWRPDGAPLGNVAGAQLRPTAIPDGSGGAIITWYDTRGASYDIYVQRISAAGIPIWTPGGVALCTATADQTNPVIVSDNAGGAIVAWSDYRPGATTDIYARRVDASGAPQWTSQGVALCATTGNQMWPEITTDGTGGAIVTWEDYRGGATPDIYVRRVDAAGTAQWTANGVALCTAVNAQWLPQIVADGQSGAIVTWYDNRSGTNYDIYARGVNFLGSPVWTSNGVVVCAAVMSQSNPTVVSDGANGAIIAWQDLRNGLDHDIYAQRLGPAGTLMWSPGDGVEVCTESDNQSGASIASDGSGGAIVAWIDDRGGVINDVYVARFSDAGVAQWTGDGVKVCDAANEQANVRMAPDGSGGAVVVWEDFRNVEWDIYAQHVSAFGVPMWSTNGVGACLAPNDQYNVVAVPDGMPGGAILVWQDSRSFGADLYAQRLEPDHGYWGHPEPLITSVADIPGDQGGKVKVNWTASNWDALNLRTITHYSIWRATEAVLSSVNLIVDPWDVSADFSGTAYLRRTTPAGDFFFEWVGNQNAVYLPAYTFSAATRADSTSQSAAQHYFIVFSHTADPFTFWSSDVDSGYSVDNLAPAAPLTLTAQRVGADVALRWNRVVVPDLRDYAVYRATSSGVTPVPPNFLSSAEDTVLIDANAPTSALYYIVTAYDIHENQSPPSNEASVSATTDVGDAPPITRLTVLSNYPNPFAGSTTFEIGLPSRADVEIVFYDVAGRQVRKQVLAEEPAGWRRVSFDGRDTRGRAIASGVYFCRVSAGGETVTRKIVIAR